MEAPLPENTGLTRNNTRTLLIVVGAVVLCCACLAIVGIGLYGWISIRGGQPQEFPAEDFPVDVTEEVTPPSSDSEVPADPSNVDTGIGEPPAGGLGNEILRNDTWLYVAFAAMGQGCDQPVGEDSTIEVLQEPQNGVWVEKWTVACSSGDSYAFEVEYVLDATGATFNIKSLP